MPFTITIAIPRKGLSRGDRSITYNVGGLEGVSCVDVTKMFEEAVSKAPTEQTLTEDYYKVPQIETRLE